MLLFNLPLLEVDFLPWSKHVDRITDRLWAVFVRKCGNPHHNVLVWFKIFIGSFLSEFFSYYFIFDYYEKEINGSYLDLIGVHLEYSSTWTIKNIHKSPIRVSAYTETVLQPFHSCFKGNTTPASLQENLFLSPSSAAIKQFFTLKDTYTSKTLSGWKKKCLVLGLSNFKACSP